MSLPCCNRREFLKTAAVGASALPLLTTTVAVTLHPVGRVLPLVPKVVEEEASRS